MLISMKYNAPGAGHYKNVLDCLSAIESGAGKAAEKFGTTVERIYKAIGFDPVDFHFPNYDAFIDQRFAKDLVIEKLEDEKLIKTNLYRNTNSEEVQETKQSFWSRLSTGTKSLILLGCVVSGDAILLYDGLAKSSEAATFPEKFHPDEVKTYKKLRDIWNYVGLANSGLEYDNSVSGITHYPLPGASKIYLQKALSEYDSLKPTLSLQQISDKSINDISENLKTITSKLPDGIWEGEDIFLADREKLKEIREDINIFYKKNHSVAYAEYNELNNLATAEIAVSIFTLIPGSIFAYCFPIIRDSTNQRETSNNNNEGNVKKEYDQRVDF